MGLRQILFEDASAGAAVTAANSGASVINKAGGNQFFTTAAAAHGNCGIEITTTASGQYNIARFTSNAASAQMASSFVFNYTGAGTNGASTADTEIAKLRQVTGENAVLGYFVDATDKFRVLDSTSAQISSTNLKYQLVPGTKYRVESLVNQTAGSTSTNLYTLSGTSPLATWAATSGLNLGTSLVNGIEFGNISSAAQLITIRIDDVQLNDGATSEIGPYSASSTPLSLSGVVTPSPFTVGTELTLTLTATGGNSNTKSFSCVWDGTSMGPQASNVFKHTDSTNGTKNWTASVTQAS